MFVLACAFPSYVAAEEVFRRELGPHDDLVLSISLDESVGHLSYNIWEETLPFDAVHAAALAIAAQKKLPWDKAEQIQTESVELIRYDRHDKDDYRGKYFYFVVLRRYTHGRHLTGQLEALLSSLPSYWAVFTNGQARPMQYEKKIGLTGSSS
ncbi:MAG: hypothetical protein M0Q93_08330 [Terrimicrobiaceae bacterium]|nr:hypothetical protein [Terrimicrobiaceae bacterium]